ncbi:MAG: 50S ribosomal protein L4 [Candidatus Omnitrophica bacterium]|nr:50S ribosomal protein L4 [Candidatus Omnitrophota bacterium]MCG2702912.1 50S ribosomal protein L4 [Candidatus Omnitrophota bacterium]
MFTLPVANLSGKEVGKVELDEKLFDGKVNIPLLHQAVLMYAANKRQGTASTKTRANVSGGNSKPWRQKGTGRARVGSSRSPLWRKGGVVFGPHPRDYSYQLPKKMKNRALLSSLNSRLNDNLVVVLDALNIDSGKTKDFAKALQTLRLERKVLFVCDKPSDLALRSSRNIKTVGLTQWETVNAADVLRYDKLVLTQKALENLTARLKKGE